MLGFFFCRKGAFNCRKKKVKDLMIITYDPFSFHSVFLVWLPVINLLVWHKCDELSTRIWLVYGLIKSFNLLILVMRLRIKASGNGDSICLETSSSVLSLGKMTEMVLTFEMMQISSSYKQRITCYLYSIYVICTLTVPFYLNEIVLPLH